MAIRSGKPNPSELDEGSWVYLASSADRAGPELRGQLAQACEASGWRAISWARSLSDGRAAPGPAHEIESVRHAVAHADAVVVLIDDRSDLAEPEQRLAEEHRRPIVALHLSPSEGHLGDARVGSLGGYDRATVIACGSSEQCGAELRSALTDPGFAATIGEAASEPSTYV